MYVQRRLIGPSFEDGKLVRIHDALEDFKLLADYDAPAWVHEAVFYQIFPDRFAKSERVSKQGLNLEPWEASPTTQGMKGGDLLGVLEHLDYLQDLGVNALYLNPIFWSKSNHGYDTADYKQIVVKPFDTSGAQLPEKDDNTYEPVKKVLASARRSRRAGPARPAPGARGSARSPPASCARRIRPTSIRRAGPRYRTTRRSGRSTSATNLPRSTFRITARPCAN